MELVPVAKATEPLFNLAEHQPAWQTSTGWGGDASRAVDGGLSSYFTDDSCSHTTAGEAVWGVRLESVSDIYYVEVLNRNQGDGQLISGCFVTQNLDDSTDRAIVF